MYSAFIRTWVSKPQTNTVSLEIESVDEDKQNSLILVNFYKTEKSDKIPPIVCMIISAKLYSED